MARTTTGEGMRVGLAAAAVALSVRFAGVAAAAGVEPPAGTAIVHPGDAAIMVYVPAGEFTMGLTEAEVRQVAADLGYTNVQALWAWEAYPKRTLALPGYFILYTWVGRYPRGISPYGALDMLGNQYEWTSELVEPYPGNPAADKMKDYAGKMVCLRGGSWYHGWVGYYAAKRFGLKPDETYYHVGFRTVWTPPDGYFTSGDFEKARAAAPERRGQLDALRKLAGQAEAAR